MTCAGCSNAVSKILNKCAEVSKVECDVEAQKVTVEGKDGLDIPAMLQKWVSIFYNKRNNKAFIDLLYVLGLIVRISLKIGGVCFQESKVNKRYRNTGQKDQKHKKSVL